MYTNTLVDFHYIFIYVKNMAAKLGQLLVSSNVISEEQLKEALGMQKRAGGRLGTNLIKLGYITEEKLVTFLSRQYGVPAVNLSEYKVDQAILKLVPRDIARKYLIMPVARVGATLTVAMADPSNVFAIDDVKFMTGYNVEVVVSSESSIISAISELSKGGGDALVTAKKKKAGSEQALKAKDYTLSDDDLETEGLEASFDEGMMIDVDEFDRVVDKAIDDVEIVDEQDGEAVKEIEQPIVKLVNGILVNAIKERSSDVHIEPYETSLRVRQRVDGIMYTVMNLPVKIKNAVTDT